MPECTCPEKGKAKPWRIGTRELCGYVHCGKCGYLVWTCCLHFYKCPSCLSRKPSGDYLTLPIMGLPSRPPQETPGEPIQEAGGEEWEGEKQGDSH